MPHGTPDWGLVGPKRTVYGLDDLGEHAARTGSPNLFDRGGDVVSLTDFSEGIGEWRAELSGLLAAYSLETEHSRTGPYCIGLTAGSTGNQYAHLIKYLALPSPSALGLEWTFTVDADTWYWAGSLQWYDGTNTWLAIVYYDRTLGTLRYYSDMGWIVNFATVGQLRQLTLASHTIKMVVDMVEHEYVRVILNETVYPLPGIAVWTLGSGVLSSLVAIVEHHGPGACNPLAYVDSVIMTQNEPI